MTATTQHPPYMPLSEPYSTRFSITRISDLDWKRSEAAEAWRFFFWTKSPSCHAVRGFGRTVTKNVWLVMIGPLLVRS